MLFMVIERFKNRDAVPVYRRYLERGRMMPEGLNFISSWISADLGRTLLYVFLALAIAIFCLIPPLISFG